MGIPVGSTMIGTTCRTNTVPLFSRARLAAVSSACIELSSKSTGQRILLNCCVIKIRSFAVEHVALFTLLSQCRAIDQVRVLLVTCRADLYPIAPLANPDAADRRHRRSTVDGKRIAVGAFHFEQRH